MTNGSFIFKRLIQPCVGNEVEAVLGWGVREGHSVTKSGEIGRPAGNHHRDVAMRKPSWRGAMEEHKEGKSLF